MLVSGSPWTILPLPWPQINIHKGAECNSITVKWHTGQPLPPKQLKAWRLSNLSVWSVFREQNQAKCVTVRLMDDEKREIKILS